MKLDSKKQEDTSCELYAENSIEIKGLVSVIMPAYNAEKYIKKAIQSILNQTYSNLELIIVEDHSQDQTLEKIKEIKDARLKLYVNDQNKGISYSTNLGIKNSSGQYLALMDDDDIALPNRLELTVKYLSEHQEVDIVGGNAVKIDDRDNIVGVIEQRRFNPKVLAARHLLHHEMINGTVLMRRKVVFDYNLWYQDGCYGMQDYLFFTMATKKVELTNITNVLLEYRIHANQETRNSATNYKEERRKKYREIQKISLDASGFKFSPEEYEVLFELVAERQKQEYTKNEIIALWNVLEKMICQAKKMNVDYIEELEWQCKKWVGERIPRMKG